MDQLYHYLKTSKKNNFNLWNTLKKRYKKSDLFSLLHYKMMVAYNNDWKKEEEMIKKNKSRDSDDINDLNDIKINIDSDSDDIDNDI